MGRPLSYWAALRNHFNFSVETREGWTGSHHSPQTIKPGHLTEDSARATGRLAEGSPPRAPPAARLASRFLLWSPSFFFPYIFLANF